MKPCRMLSQSMQPPGGLQTAVGSVVEEVLSEELEAFRRFVLALASVLLHHVTYSVHSCAYSKI